MTRTLFFADMHLMPGERPEQNRALDAALADADDATRVVFLGDMFNCWFERGERIVGDYATVFEILARHAARGVALHHVAGNRDFAFNLNRPGAESDYSGYYRTGSRQGISRLAEHGVILHGESYHFEQDGQRILCCHGDRLCTSDRSYQILRWILQGPVGRLVARIVPFSLARTIVAAVQAREILPPGLLPHANTIVPASAHAWATDSADLLLCGHIHQALDTTVTTGTQSLRIVAVPCWCGTAAWAEFADGALVIHSGNDS